MARHAETAGSAADADADAILAMIVLVSSPDNRACLLGRQARYPPKVHSTLAGFVEPGESLEEAVAREVFEESGIHIRDVRYHSSQPWPFPCSLMLGFHAEAKTAAIDINRDELDDAARPLEDASKAFAELVETLDGDDIKDRSSLMCT